MSDIGKRIKNLRLESGMTQLQLAKYCDCTGQVISNIERGYTRPDVETLNKISKSLKVPSDYLIGVTESRWIADNPYSLDTNMPKRIADLMDIQHISIVEFEKATGIPADDASEILSGQLKPNIDELSRISSLFGTTINYIIGASNIQLNDGAKMEHRSTENIKQLFMLKKVQKQLTSKSLVILIRKESFYLTKSVYTEYYQGKAT
ncbi:MAG: XRE family transcriptional regulator [Clostridia bacterium]|nr:XRE family transcriptional regulator [Clostridia bacterium]NCD02058.1 XRE family transcriptional regulator [Clostridia bacterium]